MDDYFIKESGDSPKISFDFSNDILEISGKSYPENSFKFYEPAFDWIDKYFEQSEDKNTQIDFNLIYLNSSSTKVCYDMFKIFSKEHDNGKNISIKWTFDEENDIAEEMGEDLIEDFQNLNIELIVKR